MYFPLHFSPHLDSVNWLYCEWHSNPDLLQHQTYSKLWRNHRGFRAPVPDGVICKSVASQIHLQVYCYSLAVPALALGGLRQPPLMGDSEEKGQEGREKQHYRSHKDCSVPPSKPVTPRRTVWHHWAWESLVQIRNHSSNKESCQLQDMERGVSSCPWLRWHNS